MIKRNGFVFELSCEEIELTEINRELIDLMERLQPMKSDKAQKVYKLLDEATDIINEDERRG